jgi:hypothetical protein
MATSTIAVVRGSTVTVFGPSSSTRSVPDAPSGVAATFTKRALPITAAGTAGSSMPTSSADAANAGGATARTVVSTSPYRMVV